jgi:hypothetical protein
VESVSQQRVALSLAEFDLSRKEGELLNWVIARKHYKPVEKESNFFFNLGLIEESRVMLDEMQQQALSMHQLADAAADLGARCVNAS